MTYHELTGKLCRAIYGAGSMIPVPYVEQVDTIIREWLQDKVDILYGNVKDLSNCNLQVVFGLTEKTEGEDMEKSDLEYKEELMLKLNNDLLDFADRNGESWDWPDVSDFLIRRGWRNSEVKST